MLKNTQIICSIIIPIYNGEKFLKDTINSILNQTFQNFEIIAIDDCSKDNSYKIAEEFKKNCNNFSLIKNKKNLGLIKTMNIGASLSKGRYLMVLGQDDLLKETHIQIIINDFDENTAFVHCNSERIDKNGVFIGVSLDDKVQIELNKKIMLYLSFNNIVSSTGAIINKKYFDKVGGWSEKYKNYGEWDLWIRLSKLGNVKYNTQICSKYRRHDTNITNTFQNPEVIPELEAFKNDCRNLAQNNLNLYNKFYRKYIIVKNKLKNLMKK